MPVVLSYEDVELLGGLAFEGARMGAEGQGQLQNRALAANISQGRDSTAAQLQGIQSRERIAGANLATQQDQFSSGQQFRYDQLAQQDSLAQAQLEAGMAEAGIQAQADLQQELLGNVSQQERDERLHGQRLREIEHRSQFASTSGPNIQSGVPDKKFATQEAQEFGNLIPYDAASSISPDSLARNQGRTLQTAQSLSSLPTDQLNQYIASGKIDSRWEPYVRAVVQARQQVSGGGPPVGVNPTGRRIPTQQGQGGQSNSLTQGQGFASDPRTQGLSDAELDQLARDPIAAKRFFGAQ